MYTICLIELKEDAAHVIELQTIVHELPTKRWNVTENYRKEDTPSLQMSVWGINALIPTNKQLSKGYVTQETLPPHVQPRNNNSFLLLIKVDK